MWAAGIVSLRREYEQGRQSKRLIKGESGQRAKGGRSAARLGSRLEHAVCASSFDGGCQCLHAAIDHSEGLSLSTYVVKH